MKAEHTIGMLSFVPAIMEVHILEQFAPPNFNIYDGSTDQEDHIKMFTNRMAFHTSNDASGVALSPCPWKEKRWNDSTLCHPIQLRILRALSACLGTSSGESGPGFNCFLLNDYQVG